MPIAIPALAAAAVLAAPERRARWVALGGTLLACAWYLLLALRFPWLSGATDFEVYTGPEIFAALGVRFLLGADTISMLLVGLTVLLGPVCVAASYTAIRERERSYYAWLLLIQAAMTGVFLARDAVVFFVFFEFTLVPMFVLISLWGSTNRKAAAARFFLYTFTGSILTLAALVYVAWFNAAHVPESLGGGVWDFSFGQLTRAASAYMPLEQQRWVFLGLMAGLAIKVPLFPLHTWLPLAHTEAPTAGSVILAGVLLKLGTYGIYRLVLPVVPEAAAYYAPAVGVLCLIGIVYAGLICWVQTDVKKLVAYSSVSHLGFCVLGMFALSSLGLTGSVLYMINHGLSTGGLFLLIGMIYERYHTRSMNELGGLAARMPIWATFMVFFALSSVALPGLNGFVSELLCLLGTFHAGDVWAGNGPAPGATHGPLGPWYAAIAGTGIIVAAIYLLTMVGRVVFGPLVEPGSGDGHGRAGGGGHSGAPGHSGGHAHAGPGSETQEPRLPRDLSAREIGVLAPLALLCLVLGFFPGPVLRSLEAPTRLLAGDVRAALGRNVAGEIGTGGQDSSHRPEPGPGGAEPAGSGTREHPAVPAGRATDDAGHAPNLEDASR